METLKFPYEITDVEPELVQELASHYGAVRQFVRVGPKGYFLPPKYKECAADFYNMPLRHDDIFINTCPRSGTTMTQELIWLLCNNLDFETAKSTHMNYRFPTIDYTVITQPGLEEKILEGNIHIDDKFKIEDIRDFMLGFDRIAKIPSPRFLKTHLPLSLLPPGLVDKVKVVYVARDPRDVAVSLYHYMYVRSKAPNFKTFWNFFMKSNYYFTPIFEHVMEAWKLRHHPNMLFLFYEDIRKDLSATVHKVASFLDKQCTEEQVLQICDHLSFDKFKNNPAVNFSPFRNLFNPTSNFIRKGEVGGWRECFDAEMIEQTDKWFQDNLQDTDLVYPSYNSYDESKKELLNK